jgi:hypothetical protein
LDKGVLEQEQNELRNKVNMSEFEEVKRFLGCTFEYININTGKADREGNLCLVRQLEKINEMEANGNFKEWHKIFNHKNRPRYIAVPVWIFNDNIIQDQYDLVNENDKAIYQSLTGIISWIVGCTRMECKLGYYLLARKLLKPRIIDVYLAVWIMGFIIRTKMTPLILGGEKIDPMVYADASFATLEERKSIIGHTLLSVL